MCDPLTIAATAAVIGAVAGTGSLYVANEEKKEAAHLQRKAESDKAVDKAKLDKERKKIEVESTATTAKALAAQRAARGGYGRRATLLTGSSSNSYGGGKTLLGQ